MKWPPLALPLLLLGAPVLAKNPAGGDRQLASLLHVSATDPVLRQCHDGWSTSCFRVVLRILPTGSQEMDVGHIPDNFLPKTFAARAVAGSGASCVENGGVGLPDVVVWSNGDFTWQDAPFHIAPSKAGTLLLDFGCDGRLGAGDQIIIEFSLAVDPDGRGIRTVRMTLPAVALVSMDRR
jgi:hypothetical protein